jgi:hypothetical protein
MSKTSQRRLAKIQAGHKPPLTVGTRFTRAHFWPLIRMAFVVLFKGEVHVQLKDGAKHE